MVGHLVLVIQKPNQLVQFLNDKVAILFLTFKNGTNRPVFKWYLQNGRQQAI
jgi:hypothetical protein